MCKGYKTQNIEETIYQKHLIRKEQTCKQQDIPNEPSICFIMSNVKHIGTVLPHHAYCTFIIHIVPLAS